MQRGDAKCPFRQWHPALTIGEARVGGGAVRDAHAARGQLLGLRLGQPAAVREPAVGALPVHHPAGRIAYNH